MPHNPITISITLLLSISIACATSSTERKTHEKRRSLWHGSWKSGINENNRGELTVTFPDPIPKDLEFDVEVIISFQDANIYPEGKKVTTSMKGFFSETSDIGSAVITFKGSIIEAGEIIEYIAIPHKKFTRFDGEYHSENPDDRGTFFIEKK